VSLSFSRRGLWRSSGYGRNHLTPWRAFWPLVLFVPALLLALLFGVHRRSNAVSEWVGSLAGVEHADGEQAGAQILADVRAAALNLLSAEQPSREGSLPLLQIQVQEQSLNLLRRARIEGDPALGRAPGGDRPWMRALFRAERGPWQDAKLSVHGFSLYHHLSEKPSFRLKLSRKTLRQSEREFSLMRPEDTLALANPLPEALGERIGLLGERARPVRLSLNGKHFGVYLRAARPSEELAIAQGRLPGSFWRGRTQEREGQTEHGDMWGEIACWESEDPTPASQAAVARLLEVLRAGGEAPWRPREDEAPWTPAEAEALARVLDVEAYARFEAFNAVVGGIHVDNQHNHVLFWNTYRGLLEPVLWDVNGYGFLAPPELTPNVCQHPIAARLYSDPRWVFRRDQLILELLEGPLSASAQQEALSEYLARVLPALREDPHTAHGVTRITLTPLNELEEKAAEVEEWLLKRERFLRAYLDFAVVSVQERGPGRSRVSVDGAVAVRVGGGPERGRILYPHFSRKVRAYETRVTHPADSVVPVSVAYEVRGAPHELALTNALTGAPVKRLSAQRPTEPSRCFAPPPAPPLAAERSLGPGTVELRADLFVPRGQTLRIHSGTVVRLHSGVGIYAQGKVLAEGSAAAPIRLERAGEPPWACLGIYGEGSAGSRLRHVEVEGGAPGSDGSRRFLGMVSVYFCPDLELSDCVFGANLAGDDAVNLARTRARIERCRWVGSRSDGLDLDGCHARLRDCSFVKIGNDGLDLSHSVVVAEGLRFEGCGDKGASVGEATRLLLRDSRLSGCSYGLQAKDASLALVQGCELSGNGVALRAYRKKPFFQLGGYLFVRESTTRESRIADLSLDLHCAALLWKGSQITTIGQGRERAHEVSDEALWESLAAPIRAGAPGATRAQ